MKKYVQEISLNETLQEIKKGTFVNENYLIQFEDVDSRNPIKRFFMYKSDFIEEWRGVDCDVSLTAIVSYGLLYNWLGIEKNIHLQDGSSFKYQITSKEGITYLGDTMTSAWTFLKKYLYLLWNSENASVEYKKLFEKSNSNLTIPKNKDMDCYETLFDYLAENIISDNSFLNIIDTETSGEAKAFLENYLKAGNCIVASQDFNKERSGFGKLDTVDRMLWKIYQYFNEKDARYLYQLFNNAKNKEKSVQNFKAWMSDAKITSWNNFITNNVLEPFVDMNDNEKRPISMKTGVCITDDITVDYNPMPETIEEFEVFFKNLNTRITLRSRLLWNKVLNNMRI